jgi:ABC-type phosphate transport system substrate-binding protein
MTRGQHVAIWTGVAFLALLLAFCLWAIRARPPRPKPNAATIRYAYPELGITIDNYPKVDGSTSTQPIQMIMACKLFGVTHEWFHSEGDDTRGLWPVVDERFYGSSREEFVQEDLLCAYLRDLVQVHGTSEAYLNLINNRIDLALVARSPSEDELTVAGKRGVQLDVRPVALDAFVFLLNGENPVSSLTIEQIRDIYSGRIVNWRDIGGPDAPIRPYQRPRNSGSQELMKTRVMRGRRMIEAPDLLTGSLMSTTFLALDKDVHGIGYSVYYYHEFMSPNKNVKACAVDGVSPTSENIRTRRYPLVAEVYVVTRRDVPREHSASRLRDWILGPAGQRIVEESGYVPISEIPNASAR